MRGLHISSVLSLLTSVAGRQRSIAAKKRPYKKGDAAGLGIKLPPAMGGLPEDIVYDILSRMPVKDLNRFRCVCKEWCRYIDEPRFAIIQMNRAAAAEDELIPIMYKYIRNEGPNAHDISLFDITEGTTAEKKSVLEFECIEEVRGSCNGLLYLSRDTDYRETSFCVMNPLRKEQRYELPPIMSMESCGLGFDASANAFKMCASVKEDDSVHTMVHVLGTDSWREIPQSPFYKTIGDGVFADGCLHWLGYANQQPIPVRGWSHRFKVIRFDVRKEEFGVLHPPRKHRDYDEDDLVSKTLVDLHGKLGFVYANLSFRKELWVLKENHQWVMLCGFDTKPPPPCRWINIEGFWNKSGSDILVRADGADGGKLFVYSLKTRGFQQVNLVGWDWEEDRCVSFIHMHRNTLFSIPATNKSPIFLSSKTRSSSKKRKRKTRNPSKLIYRFLKFC